MTHAATTAITLLREEADFTDKPFERPDGSGLCVRASTRGRKLRQGRLRRWRKAFPLYRSRARKRTLWGERMAR